MRSRLTTPIHGRTTWCSLTIWVWFDRENEEWFAEVQNPEREDSIARVGGYPSQEAAESALCDWLQVIVAQPNER
jgi:hypothetical protein